MAHQTTLRSRTQPRPQQQVQEQNWEDENDDNFDVALHVANHAHRLKNVDRALNHFEQSLKNFQAVYLEERSRQNKLLGILAGCFVLSVLVTALWPRHEAASPQSAAIAQQRAVQQQIQQQLAPPAAPAPVQMPQAQQTYNPNYAALQTAQIAQAIAPQVQVPSFRPAQPSVTAMGARYDQQQRPPSQSYIASPATQPLYQQPAPQVPQRLSQFQLNVQNKLAARGEAVPPDWQPYFDREARGDKKGKLLIAAKFLKGEGVTRDQAFAVEMIRQAADAGEKEAMMWLAYANQGGNIGKKDINAAIRWFQAAGKAGVAQAYTELGKIYETGADGAPDLDTAVAWYQRGAQAGDAKSAEAMARLTGGQAAQQQMQQPYQQPYVQPTQSPAQQLQQLMQTQGGIAPMTQNNYQDPSAAAQMAAPSNVAQSDIFVPAPAAPQPMQAQPLQNNSGQIHANALRPVDTSDDDVAPAYPATPVVASVPTPAPSSQVGMSKEQANDQNKSIQRMLRTLGYKIDRLDGEYGPQTASAIRAYQRDHSLYPDGEPSAELIEALARDVNGQ